MDRSFIVVLVYSLYHAFHGAGIREKHQKPGPGFVGSHRGKREKTLCEKEKVLTRHLVLNKGSDKDNLDLFHCFDRKTLRGVHRLFRGVHFPLGGANGKGGAI